MYSQLFSCLTLFHIGAVIRPRRRIVENRQAWATMIILVVALGFVFDFQDTLPMDTIQTVSGHNWTDIQPV